MACESKGYEQSHAYGSIPKCSPSGPDACRRIVQDGFATEGEAATVLRATENAMVGLFHQGGATSLVPDAMGGRRLGPSAHVLVSDLVVRVREAIRREYVDEVEAGGNGERGRGRVGEREVWKEEEKKKK